MATKKTCPFGHTCDQCLLYMEKEFNGVDGKVLYTKSECAFLWIAQATHDGAKFTDQTTQSVQSLRNQITEIERDKLLLAQKAYRQRIKGNDTTQRIETTDSRESDSGSVLE